MRSHSVFPLASPLRSIDSAPPRGGLFADFVATMKESDFSCPCVIGFGSSPSRCGPLGDATDGQAGDLPVPEQRACGHARF